jgi:hypothetical protein
MLRKVLLRAAVALAAGVEHFRPISSGWEVELDGRDLPLDVEETHSSVTLQTLRAWNDARVERIRVGLGESDWEPPQTTFKIASNKITARRLNYYEAEQVEFGKDV